MKEKLKMSADLRKLGVEELQKELDSAQKELFSLKMRLIDGKERQPHLVKELRRYVARIKTVATESNVVLK